MDSAPVNTRINTPQFPGRFEEDDVIIEGSCGGPYMVEKIVGIYMAKDKKKYYRVKWIDSWEPEENLSEACQALINEFWTGTTLDPLGKIVKKDELKQGLKVVKKENPLSPTQETKKDSFSPTKLPLLTKACEEETSSSNNGDLKSKIMPSLNIVTSTNNHKDSPVLSPNLNKPSDAITKQLSPVKNNQPTSQLVNKQISPMKSKKVVHTTTEQLAEVASYMSADVINANMISRTEAYVDENNMLHSAPPLYPEVDNSDGGFSDCNESPLTSVELQYDSVTDDTDTDLNCSNVEECTENVVDLYSDDDLEITVSIESPRKRKKGDRLSNLFQSSSPVKRRSVRQPQSAPRLRNKESVRANKTMSSVRPLHPRRLLGQSSQSDGEKSSIRTSPLRRSINHAGAVRNKTISSTITSPNQRTQLNGSHPLPSHSRSTNVSSQTSSTLSTFINADSPANKSVLQQRTCTLCNYTFPNITIARQHVKSVHSTPSESVLPTNCHVCNGIFRSNRDLKSHMLLHSDQTLYKCDVCSRAFRQRSVLNQHLLIHSEELPFRCEICQKRFRQQAHLILHMGKHGRNNEGVYTCPHCLCDFTDKNEFSTHMRQHDAELPFCCNLCQERFKQKSDLLIHLDGHNEGRPFTCHICKKSFKMKTYLYGHMQMHKVERNNTPVAESATTNGPDDGEKETKVKRQLSSN